MKHGPGFAAALSIAGSVLATPHIAWARDVIRMSADVTATGGYSSNPFAEIGHDLGSPYAELDADPQVSLIAEHRTITLRGRLNLQHYFHRYGDTSDYLAGLDYAATPTARLTTHASVAYDSSVLGGFGLINPVVNPAPPPPTTGPDISLFGTKTRRNLLSFNGDAGYTLSARDSLNASAFYDASRYGGATAKDANFDGYGATVGYSRRISDPLRLGAQASVSRYVYQGLLGKSQVYSLQATVNDDFSSRWNLSGALGVSYSDRSLGGKKLSPTGNLQLCRRGARSSLCVTATESVLPTGVAGAVVTKSIGATYSYQLSEHSRFSLSSNYLRDGQPPTPLLVNRLAVASSYFTASANYDRTLRERIHLLATLRYRSITGGGPSRSGDFGGTLGISVRFGDNR